MRVPFLITELDRTRITAFLGSGLSEGDERLVFASPISHVTPKSAPRLLIHSRADKAVPFEQSLRFKASCEKAGVPIEIVAVEAAPHTFWFYSRWFPDAMAHTIVFFRPTFGMTS